MNTTLAPAAPPPLSQGGREPLRVILVIAAVAIVATVVALLTAGALGLSALRLVADHQALPAGMRTLTVDTAGSPAAVRIVTDRDASEPRVNLRMVTTHRGDRDELTVTNAGNDTQIRVDAQAGMLAFGDPGEITITLPPDLGDQLAVTVQQDTGVLIADADLDELTVTNTDGAVLLHGAVRRMEVRGQDSEVRARQPITVTESFTASTVDGDVQVRFAESPPERIDVSTRDGDISLGLPTPGPYLVRAQSGDGSATVRVPQTTDPARAAAEVTARSENGEVSVEPLRAGRR